MASKGSEDGRGQRAEGATERASDGGDNNSKRAVQRSSRRRMRKKKSDSNRSSVGEKNRKRGVPAKRATETSDGRRGEKKTRGATEPKSDWMIRMPGE